MHISGRHRKPRPVGMELFEITPVVVGGDPVDPKNKTWLTRRQGEHHYMDKGGGPR